MTILTKAEAEKFLTKADLLRLKELVEASKLLATVTSEHDVLITIRGASIPLFAALELLGTV
jgi:hypothetical protein